MSILYTRKHWHSLSHSLHFVGDMEGNYRPTHPFQRVIFKPGSRLPIFNSVYLGTVPGHIDSPYLIIMSWITIPRDEYYTHGFFYLVIILLIPILFDDRLQYCKGNQLLLTFRGETDTCSTRWLQNVYCKILFKIQMSTYAKCFWCLLVNQENLLYPSLCKIFCGQW